VVGSKLLAKFAALGIATMAGPSLALRFVLQMMYRDLEAYHDPRDVELDERQIYTEAKLYVLPLQFGLKHLE
jgi:hypothetical protein